MLKEYFHFCFLISPNYKLMSQAIQNSAATDQHFYRQGNKAAFLWTSIKMLLWKIKDSEQRRQSGIKIKAQVLIIIYIYTLLFCHRNKKKNQGWNGWHTRGMNISLRECRGKWDFHPEHQRAWERSGCGHRTFAHAISSARSSFPVFAHEQWALHPHISAEMMIS